MLTFIMENLATIIISALLLLVVALIVRKLWRDRKQGGCGCGCSSDCADSCPFTDNKGKG